MNKYLLLVTYFLLLSVTRVMKNSFYYIMRKNELVILCSLFPVLSLLPKHQWVTCRFRCPEEAVQDPNDPWHVLFLCFSAEVNGGL